MNDDARHEHLIATIDRLAAEIRDPMQQLARMTKAPIPVIQRSGFAVFDTLQFPDANSPLAFLSKDRQRYRVTLVNSGSVTIVIANDPHTSLIGAGTFKILAGVTLPPLNVKGPLYASVANIVGAELSYIAEELPEQ